MDIILAFVLYTNAGIKIDYAPQYIFNSLSQCQQFAIHESRKLIIERYKGKGVHRATPACQPYTRDIALKIEAERFGI